MRAKIKTSFYTHILLSSTVVVINHHRNRTIITVTNPKLEETKRQIQEQIVCLRADEGRRKLRVDIPRLSMETRQDLV